MIWVYVIVFVILAGATWFLRRRRPDSSMTTYRKHIDALSSESRRGVREEDTVRRAAHRDHLDDLAAGHIDHGDLLDPAQRHPQCHTASHHRQQLLTSTPTPTPTPTLPLVSFSLR